MPRLPRITALELLRALRRDGWLEVNKAGRHVQLKHPTKRGKVTVGLHTGKMIPPHVLASVLKQASISSDELRDLL